MGLVNLVYAFPLLVRPEMAETGADNDVIGRDDTVNPRLPHGGINDHMLLRLSTSLQLTQLLLLQGGKKRVQVETAASVTECRSVDDMDVDGEGAGDHDEATELWLCWKQLRSAATLTAEVRLKSKLS